MTCPPVPIGTGSDITVVDSLLRCFDNVNVDVTDADRIALEIAYDPDCLFDGTSVFTSSYCGTSCHTSDNLGNTGTVGSIVGFGNTVSNAETGHSGLDSMMSDNRAVSASADGNVIDKATVAVSDSTDFAISNCEASEPTVAGEDSNVNVITRCGDSGSSTVAVGNSDVNVIVGTEEGTQGTALATSSTTGSSSTELHSQRGRRRIRDMTMWKCHIRKRLRNTGDSYISRTGITHRHRLMGPGCGCKCRHKCHDKISDAQRDRIFAEFWQKGCLHTQRQFLITHAKSRPTKPNAEQKCKKRSIDFTFHVAGQISKVCKTFFCRHLQ